MVNTFLVHSDYALSARFLDLRRLGKQRLEAHHMIQVLLGEKKSWINHPATKAWSNHMISLKHYFNCIVREWIRRGCKNSYALYDLGDESSLSDVAPPWTKSPRIHYSMMAQLQLKDPTFYNVPSLKEKIPPHLLQYFESMPSEYLRYGYVWPSNLSLDDLNNKPLEELASAAQEHKICKGLTKSGLACRNKAKYGFFCGVHKH
jgi:hypothetical protein